MKLIITLSTLLATTLARPSYLTASPLAYQNNHIATSYSNHQIIPGSASYQSYESIEVPTVQASLIATPQVKAYNPYFLSSSFINPYQQVHYRYEPIAHQQFLAPHPIGISHIPAYPSYIPQHPTFIAQHPTVIPQPPQFIGQIPIGTIPQNPVQIPVQPGQPSPIYPGSPNPPTGTEIDSDTVAVDAARSNKEGESTGEDFDDTVSIEASPRSGEPLEKSTEEKKNEKIEDNDSRTTYERVVVAAKTNQETQEKPSNTNTEKKAELRTISQPFPGYPVIPAASRTFFGNPTYLANQNALSKLIQTPIGASV